MKVIEIQGSPFNERQLYYLRPMISRIAAKHMASYQYVNKIVRGKTPVKTEKAKKIFEDLVKLADLLDDFFNDNKG